MASITYAKLRDGTWGIRAEGTVRAGETVTVRKKDGPTKTETVGKVLWEGEGVTLASIGSSNTGKSRGGAVCAECGKGGALVADLEDGMMKHRRCCDIEP